MENLTYFQHKLHPTKLMVYLGHNVYYKISTATTESSRHFQNEFGDYYSLGNKAIMFPDNWKELGVLTKVQLPDTPSEININ